MEVDQTHPYVMFWRERDLEQWMTQISTEIVLDSPVLRTPLVGREQARSLSAALLASFERLDITEQHHSSAADVFFWETTVRGSRLHGVDRITMDDACLVDRITVYVRPLYDIALFAGAMTPALTRASPIRSTIARATGPGLRALFRLVEASASRLTGMGGDPLSKER